MSRTALGWVVAGFVSGLLLAGGGTGSSSGARSGKTPAFAKLPYQPPKSGCGSYPPAPPNDPHHALDVLPANVRANYAGYNRFVGAGHDADFVKSAWANWKPRHGPPYKVT